MRVPEVVAICDAPELIGASFYVMNFVDGHVLGDLPPEFDTPGAAVAIANQLVDALVELHAVDVSDLRIASFGRPSGYLKRQIRRFRGLVNAAGRELPALEQVAQWLSFNLPPDTETAVVQETSGSATLCSPRGAPRLAAVLDWEMATLGDPLADLGYLTAMWGRREIPPIRCSTYR